MAKKKNLAKPLTTKRSLIEPDHPHLSIRRQCDLIGLHRASDDYQLALESEENISLMKLIDQQYTQPPFYGSRRMRSILWRQGYQVSRKKGQGLRRQMGLTAIYPKAKKNNKRVGHKIYLYLLAQTVMARPNQVWSTDSYIPLKGGFSPTLALAIWWQS